MCSLIAAPCEQFALGSFDFDFTLSKRFNISSVNLSSVCFQSLASEEVHSDKPLTIWHLEFIVLSLPLNQKRPVSREFAGLNSYLRRALCSKQPAWYTVSSSLRKKASHCRKQWARNTYCKSRQHISWFLFTKYENLKWCICWKLESRTFEYM